MQKKKWKFWKWKNRNFNHYKIEIAVNFQRSFHLFGALSEIFNIFRWCHFLKLWSKLAPTPNIDRLVSKGINFRDGHACSARCAPSRYCLLTGRHHFRRGTYHSAPVFLSYGRKIMSHMFKRNNYATFVVGKNQPLGSNKLGSLNSDQVSFFIQNLFFFLTKISFLTNIYSSGKLLLVRKKYVLGIR